MNESEINLVDRDSHWLQHTAQQRAPLLEARVSPLFIIIKSNTDKGTDEEQDNSLGTVVLSWDLHKGDCTATGKSVNLVPNGPAVNPGSATHQLGNLGQIS